MKKKWILLAISILLASYSFAQGKPLAKKDQISKQEQAKEKPVFPIPKAMGPTGIGPLKLGMTKDAIEALQSGDGVYLSAPMTPHEDKDNTTKGEEEKFNGLLITPFSATPLKMLITFKNGQMAGLSASLESPSMFEQLNAQIALRYGPGKVDDSRKEKQCIYKNGANFTLKSGTISTKWIAQLSATESVETRLLDYLIDVCPADLRYGRLTPFEGQTLIIRRLNSSAEAKTKNLF